MRYIGGKARIAKDICKVILTENPKVIVEPFCGALNVSVELVKQSQNIRVFCSDAHSDLIDMWKAVQDGWLPPTSLSEEEYYALKEQSSSPLRTFAGYGCSFSGKWFGGYAKDNTGRNYCLNARNSILKKVNALNNITFNYGGYEEQYIPQDAIVYCDPPYAETTKPGERSLFDHQRFWSWVVNLPNVCYVSEYSSPNQRVVWEKTVKTDMHTKNGQVARIEKLFCNK